MEQKLEEKIQDLTPKLVNTRLIVKGPKTENWDYEAERKIGISKYWGYSFPEYSPKDKPKEHYKKCLDALDSMETKIKNIFSDLEIKTNERLDKPFDSERITTEKRITPLFEESYAKILLIHYTGRIIHLFKTLAERFAKLIKQDHADFCETMNQLNGLSGNFNPDVKRIITFRAPEGEVIFSVTPQRYFRANWEQAGIYIAPENTAGVIGHDLLPIFLQFKGFDLGNKKFRELHEQLAVADFSPIKREFPFVPTQGDINLNKFSKLTHEHAEKGEYAKSYIARRTIEKALKKEAITFEEAESLMPSLLNGKITKDTKIIKEKFE